MRLIVAKIDADPSLIQIGVENMKRWRREQGGYQPRCLDQWDEWFESDEPWERIRERLLEASDEGQRLRTSNPFASVLTQEERESVYDFNWGGTQGQVRKTHRETMAHLERDGARAIRTGRPMNRSQLEHLIRAAADITGESEFVIIGSQAILGQHCEAPDPLLVSMEADIHPTYAPEKDRGAARAEAAEMCPSRARSACERSPTTPPGRGEARRIGRGLGEPPTLSDFESVHVVVAGNRPVRECV